MLTNLRNYLVTRKTLSFLLVAFFIGGVVLIVYQGVLSKQEVAVEEVDLPFDSEGPFALLFPRRDGNAVILNLKRTSSYDKISYELAYTSKADDVKASSGDEIGSGGVDRGVVGEVSTKEKKGEYEQEILFGTCSKNICKYDKGVQNGTLTLHIRKGNKAYRMITQWHLQKPDVALGILSSGDEHLTYTISARREELALVGFVVINDLTGAPKLPDGKQIVGKVYGLNVPLAKELMPGQLKVELATNPPKDAKLARFDSAKNKWIWYETKTHDNILTAAADGYGIFAVLTSKK